MKIKSKNHAEDLAETRRIVLDGLAEYSAKVYLFGSHASGKIYRSSDIDVAVLPIQPIPRIVFAEIREALEKSNVLFQVDLLNLSEVDESFREHVLEEGIEWTP